MNLTNHAIRWALRMTLVGFLTAVPILPAMASEPARTTGDAPQSRRYFGGHLFMPSSSVPEPFITTTLANSTGFGQASNLIVPIRNMDGEQLAEFDANIVFLFLDFGYQQAFGERFAARVSVIGGARSGTSAEAILSEGISSIYGYALGGSVGIVERRNWKLTGTADMRTNTLYGVFPGAFLRAIVEQIREGDTTNVPVDSLVSSDNNLRVLAGLRGAWTPTPCLGFTAFLETGLGTRFEADDDNLVVVNTGASLGFDFRPLTNWPIGVVASGRFESLGERGDDKGRSEETLGLGLFYTGRRDLVIGLDSTWGHVARQEADGMIDTVQGRIILRYDFN